MAIEVQNPVETVIGAAVLSAAIAFGVYAAQTSGVGSPSSGSYQVVAKFRSASGLAAGTDVRVAGVKVGRVEELSLDPTSYRALAILSVDKSVELTDDTFASIDSEGLLGATFVDLDPGAGEKTLGEGDVIRNTQGAVSLIDLLAAFANSDEGSK